MEEKVLKILSEQFSMVYVEIEMETSFKEDLGADSLDLFEMLMALEEEFGIEIPPEDFEQLTTGRAVIDYLKEKGVEE